MARYSNIILDKKEKGVTVEDLQGLYEKKDYTFADEMAATWHVEWIGQAVRNEIDFQAVKHLDRDPEYDPFTDENLEGFEDYRDFFVDQNIKNKEHHEILKDRIARNQYYRKVRDQAGLLPQFTAALGDPLTYVPLPFIKGVSFGNRALKGAGAIGTLQTLTELPVRRQLDPTLSDEESYAYIFGSMMFGGILSGALARRTVGSATDIAANKGDSYDALDNIYKEMWDAEHVGFKSNVLDEQVKDIKYSYKDGDETIEVNLRNQSQYKGIAIADDTGEVLINMHRMVEMFESHNYRNYFDGFNIPEFRSVRDLMDYMVQSAVTRQRNPNLKADEIHQKVLDNVLAGINERKTAGNSFVRKLGALFSDYEEIISNRLTVQGGNLAKMAEKLFGDYGTKMKANEYGFASESSALIEHQVEHVARIKKSQELLNDLFLKFKTGMGSQGTIKDYNPRATFVKTATWVNKKLKKYGKEVADYDKEIDFDGFNVLVGKAMRSEKAYQDADEPIKEAADMLRELFDDLGEQGSELGMFASQKSYDKLVYKLTVRQKEANEVLKNLKGDKRKRMQKYKRELDRQLRNAKKAAEDFTDRDTLNPLLKNYVPRVYDVERIIDDLAEMDAIWKDSAKDIDLKTVTTKMAKTEQDFKNYGKTKEFYVVPPANSLRGVLYRARQRDVEEDIDVFERNVIIQKQIDNITRNAQRLDMDGDLGIGKAADGSVKFGQSNFMGRNITATDEELDAFLIHDINYLFQTYSDRIGKRIAVAKKFGDANMNDALLEMEFKMVRDDWSPATAKEIDVQLQRMYDAKDKFYNVFNNSDPTSFWKSRLPMFLRNWASLAYMGKAVYAAVVDAARVPMVHGFENTWKYFGGNSFLKFRDPLLAKGIQKNAWMFDAAEVVMNNASQARFMEIGQPVGRKSGYFNRKFDKLNSAAQKLQSPLYHLNLLSGWTKVMKDWSAALSSHRFLEDCIKVADGKASKFDIERLASYGISPRDARQIAKLPIQKTKSNYHYTNSDDWASSPNGEYLASKLRYAVAGDVNRTIVTPSIADKPNMMYGVIKVQSDTWNKVLNNGFGKWLGYEEKRFGGQINNGFLVLPMQFWSWSVAANRKLAVSGFGQGRDANVTAGIMGLIAMGTLADYLKNPDYWERKPVGERIFRSIELSGTVDLAMQVNNMFETASYAFDDPFGLRTMVGLEPRFKDQDAMDAISGVGGAGPSVLFDTAASFLSDDSFEGRAANLRRSLPFSNLLWWDMFFHPYKAIEKGIVNIVD